MNKIFGAWLVFLSFLLFSSFLSFNPTSFAARLAPTGTVPQLSPLQPMNPGTRANLSNNIQFQDRRMNSASLSPGSSLSAVSSPNSTTTIVRNSAAADYSWLWLVIIVAGIIVIFYVYQRRTARSAAPPPTEQESSHIKYE